MTVAYCDLRYLRVEVDDLDAAARFASDLFGLQVADRDESRALFRSDTRNYSICFSRVGEGEAVALTVAQLADFDKVAERLTVAGHSPRRLDATSSAARQAKEVLAVTAPNGVTVEIVWRPLTSGWRYHGPRDAGIVGLQAVSLACTNVAANEAFWTRGLGLTVTDWVGDAAYLALDDAHHRIALYPSKRDGILGASWAVEGKDNIMANWYFLQKVQAPIVAGPGRQPASNAMFVTTRGPRGLLMSYAAETDAGPHILARGPRQFPNVAASHCAWGSPTEQPEFLGVPRMIELNDVVYCRLGTADLAGAEWYAVNILGLEVAERRKGATYFKSDHRAHTLCYFEGDPENQTVGFELGRSEDLQAAGAALEELGHAVHHGTSEECAARHVRAFIRFRDPSGNRIEFVVRPETTGQRYHGTRDAGITGFSHVGLCTTDPARDEAFWTTVCNARVSDRIGDAPLMRLGTIHHSIALFPFHKPGIQHINHQVGGTDDIQRSYNFVRDNQVKVTFGPGRHPTSSAEFLYFSGPEGMTFEYSTGVRQIHDEPAWRDRQFPFSPKGFCQWGAVPQIAAFRESSA